MTQHPLTEPESPDTLDPSLHHPIAGDWSDDDPRALDEYFQAGDPSSIQGAVGTTYDTPAVEEIKPTTRLISRVLPVGVIGGVIAEPVQALPADRLRQSLRITCTIDCRIAGQKADVYSAPITLANNYWDMDSHTGSVWVWADVTNAGAAQTLPGTLGVWAVTE